LTEEPFISQDDIEALKLRDGRWKQIETAIAVDNDLQHNFTVNLILEALTRRSTEAMEDLINVDPLDTRRVTSLQEKINCARFIGEYFKKVREDGLVAQSTLEDEGNVELEEKPPNDGRER